MLQRIRSLRSWQLFAGGSRPGVPPPRSLASLHLPSPASSPFGGSVSPFFGADAGSATGKKTVEEIMPIATGHEREELEAELEGKKRFDMDAPVGPFGTKGRTNLTGKDWNDEQFNFLPSSEAPALVHSYSDKRIVGCPGGEGEDEHDVVWFWLEKGKPHECPVCSQYFALEVIGEGGPPEGHGEDDH